MSKIKLYGFPLSGHSHRVEVFLSILGLDAEINYVDLANGEHKKTEFLKKNMFGQVPILEDDGVTLSDSNAILTYLAMKYDKSHSWSPGDVVQAAEVQRFLTISAGLIVNGPAAARLVTVFGSELDQNKAIEIAHSTLSILEVHMEGRNWLATDKPTIADIANYTYIAHAPEGNVSLEEYPNIRTWLKRFETLPGFIPMQVTKVGLAA